MGMRIENRNRELFLHRVFGYRGVIIFPWLARVFDRCDERSSSLPPLTKSTKSSQSNIHEIRAKSVTYYQVLTDTRDMPHIRAQTEAVTFLGNQERDRNLYAIPGLDYVAQEDIVPYTSTERTPIEHELFDKFLIYDSETTPNFVPREYLKSWQERHHQWLELSDVAKDVTHQIRVTVIPFYMGSRSAQGVAVHWWRYSIRVENLNPDEPVTLRERHWRIFSLSGTLETVRGKGVVGQEPRLSKEYPAFQYSSHISLSASSGHMWGTFKMEKDDGTFIEVRIPPFNLEYLMNFSYLIRQKLVVRQFHTSSPRHIHPLIWIILKPALKGAAWLTGRSARKWYRGLPEEKRSIFFQHLNRHKYKYVAIFGTIGSTFGYHYSTHIQIAPITGRKRYMLMTEEQLKYLCDLQKEELAKTYANHMMPENSKETQLVAKVAKKIISANVDLPNVRSIKWTIRVLNIDDQKAFVLPSGDIYVTRGMLQTVANEDQLAIVLGHEISHTLLDHSGENLSYLQLVDFLGIFASLIIWSVFPSDWASFFVTYLFERFLTFANRLPYSRTLEEEADEVGLMLAAKACYDIRESVRFWQKIHELQEKQAIPEFFSTHPASNKRAETLKRKISWALEIRHQCNCLPLIENITLGLPKILEQPLDKKTGLVHHIPVTILICSRLKNIMIEMSSLTQFGESQKGKKRAKLLKMNEFDGSIR
ncbi:unnamed protein product [Rotaria socialis]|uniref:ApaG domain-containing protein n=1 Tax=Rotaria socialis TaxID=392032 RepID=A0A818BEV2_9BILA|nr:unnamed protein product [Rotaria socialis]